MIFDKQEDLLHILQSAGEIGSVSVATVSRFMVKWQCSAFDAVLECNLINEQMLADVLARHFNIERLSTAKNLHIGADSFCKLSYEDAVKWEVFPLGYAASGDRFRLLIVNPTNYERLDQVLAKVGSECSLVIAERSLVRRIIDEHYPIELQVPSLAKYVSGRGSPPDCG